MGAGSVFSDAQVQGLVVPMTVIAQDMLAARSETTKEAFVTFVMPYTGVVVGYQGCLTAITGTTQTLALTLERGTTVLSTLTLATANTPARNAGLSLKVFAGETLNVKAATGHTDVVCEGIVCILEVQIGLPVEDA